MTKILLLLSMCIGLVASNAAVRYDYLYHGGAYTSDAAFPGTNYFKSDDNDWRAFVYPGIKYASAKRFEPSTLNYNHDYLRNTSMPKHGFVCPQTANEAPYVSGTPLPLHEDCLYLDVYVPPVFKNHLNLGWAKWPVLVWIHGGHFRMGHKDVFNAGELAMSIGAVVVKPNYRVGPFGFLSSGDHVATGNWALYDLKLALKWIHKHIEGFGGEKTKVTLAGERAGAVLVSMLLLDDEVRGLVHGAMTFSGNIFSPWAVQHDPTAVTLRLANDVGCPNDTLKSIPCLKNLTMVELLDSAARVEKQMGTPLGTSIWAPVVDGLQVQFLPSWYLEGPSWNLKGGYITGYSTNDAAWPLLMKTPRIFGHNTIDHEWIYATFIPSLLEYVYRCDKTTDQHRLIVQSIYSRYGFQGVDSTSKELRQKLIRLTNDVFYAMPALKESSLYAKTSTAALGNQLFVVASDDNYGVDSITPVPETAYLFGQIKTNIGNNNNNRSSACVTRELRRLLGHVVRHGNGFGSQFDRAAGNILTLGKGHEWRSGWINADELLKFWEPFHKLGCMR